MSSTYLSLHYHLVFRIHRESPLMPEKGLSQLHDYLGGTLRGLDGFPQGVGWVPDHVHILAGLKATHCLADVMRELKKSSSVWIRKEFGLKNFRWQEGYAGFTVSATSRRQVKNYIANQKEHHRKISFHDELIQFLKQAGVEYDPKYLD